MILGGSTNAVLHLIAMAHSVGITLTIDDFQNVSDRTPFLADIKPSGKYVMEDVYKLGGIPSESFRRRFVQVYLFAEILHYLLKNNRIQGDNMTVTGKTLGENLDRWVHQHGELDFHTQRVIMPLDKPIKPSGHIRCVHVSSVRELFVPINHVRLNVIPIPFFVPPLIACASGMTHLSPPVPLILSLILFPGYSKGILHLVVPSPKLLARKVWDLPEKQEHLIRRTNLSKPLRMVPSRKVRRRLLS